MEDKNCISCFHWSPTLGTCKLCDARIDDPEHEGCSCYVSFDGEEGGIVCTQS